MMSDAPHHHRPRLGPVVWLLTAVWAIGLVIAPLTGLVARSLTSVEATPIEIRDEIAHLAGAVEAARDQWERTVDPERRAEIDRRIRLFADRARRLADHDGAPRDTVGFANFARVDAPAMAALWRGLAIAMAIAALSAILCYPVAWATALALPRERGILLLVAAIAPHGLDALLGARAWGTILAPVIDLVGTSGVAFVALLHAQSPLMLLALHLVLRRLDPRLIEAARDLGAAPSRIHASIVAPHALPGLAIGAAATFALTVGALATPLVVDRDRLDARLPTLVWRQIFRSDDWNLGTAHAVVLLAACLLGTIAVLRIFGVGRRHLFAPPVAGHSGSGAGAGMVPKPYLALFLAFTLAPAVVTVAPFPVSPTGFGGPAVMALLGDDRLGRGLLGSLVVGLAVTAVALPLGLAGALALHRREGRGATLLFALLVSPLLAPGLVLGLSTSILGHRLGLTGGPPLVVVAETGAVAAAAMVLFLVRLARLDPAVEQAARDLGASRGLVLRRILAPHLAPAAAVAGLVAFVLSFRDHDAAAFVVGAQRTLATVVAERLRFGPSPALDALGAVEVAAIVAVAALWLGQRRRLRRIDAHRRGSPV
ncbi:MAG: ABC transporter permease subunit [Siculibacillus sp.]|nr:ABC transporter permease subunit [Siculibacillus sp.]